MSPAAVAALGRRHGRYAYLVHGGSSPPEPAPDAWVDRGLDARGARLYRWAFRSGFADAVAGRQAARQREDGA